MNQLILLISIVAISFNLKAQSGKQETAFLGNDTVEVVFFNDEVNPIPTSMQIEAKIVGVSKATSCGVMASSGTLKVRLIHSNEPLYTDSVMYIVVNCLSLSESRLMGLKFTAKVRPLILDKTDYYQPILNKFDSGGKPFYWLPGSFVNQLNEMLDKKQN